MDKSQNNATSAETTADIVHGIVIEKFGDTLTKLHAHSRLTKEKNRLALGRVGELINPQHGNSSATYCPLPLEAIEEREKTDEPQHAATFDDFCGSSATTSGSDSSGDDIIPIFAMRKTYTNNNNEEEENAASREEGEAGQEPAYAVVGDLYYSGPSSRDAGSSSDSAIRIFCMGATRARAMGDLIILKRAEETALDNAAECGSDSEYDVESFLQDALDDELTSDEPLSGSDSEGPASENAAEPGSRSEYDINRFLPDALGADATSYESLSESDSESAMSKSSISTSELSRLVSKDSVMDTSTSRGGVTTADNSGATSRRNSSKAAVSVGAAPAATAQDGARKRRAMSRWSARSTALILEASRQSEAMLQMSKVLLYCQSTPEYANSKELVEAERLLLIAEQRRRALLAEFDNVTHSDDLASLYTGVVTINSLHFLVKPSRTDCYREYVNWFVCVFTHREKILATKAIGHLGTDPTLNITGPFTFTDLDYNFRIEVAVYAMVVKNRMTVCCHETDDHLNKVEKTCCSQFPKIFRRSNPTRPESPICTHYTLKESAFKLCARTSFSRGQLKSTRFALDIVSYRPRLADTATIPMTAYPTCRYESSGFVVLGEPKGEQTSWSRLWCKLSGQALMFWRYPANEGRSFPTVLLDLGECVDHVNPADRTICPRPRTLVVDVKRPGFAPPGSVARYFIQAETPLDFNRWRFHLNAVVVNVKMWRGGGNE